MDQARLTTGQQEEKSDWQLFTNDGKFDSKLPPYKRLIRLKSAPAIKKGYKLYVLPIPKPKALNLEKPQPQLENVENYVVVWLDQSAGKPRNNEASKTQLQQVVNCVKIFTDPKQCQAFMSTVKDEKIFLIISGIIEEDFVSNVHEEEQLESIYVFYPNKIKEEPWFSKYSEISGIYTTIMSLCEQLGKDVKKIDRTLLGIEIMGRTSSNSTSKTNKQDASFMYDQLFRDIVLTVPDENMDDMYEFCGEVYRENYKEQLFIKEMKETYPLHSTIWWYTRESFLYRNLNKALYTHHYDMLYLLRVFIRHLHGQIVKQQANKSMDNRKLFRGQGMEKKDFDRLRENEGGLISFSNFLSTSQDHKISLGFARDALRDKKRVAVLLEITVEKNTIIPAADITHLSAHQNEKEWLFSMGSVFRIGSLKQSSDGIWIVPLTLTDDHDQRLTALKEHLKKSMADRNACLNFANLMYQLAQWKQSEYFYLMALKTETTPERRSVLFNGLAMIKGELKQYDEALAYYEISLGLKGSAESDKATTYNNIATLYYEQNKMDRANEYYQKAIEACNAQGNSNESLLATLHVNIAGILNDQGKHEEALEKCEEALKIRIKILPEIHPRIATTYSTIASTLLHMKLYDKAIEYAEKALDIDRQALPARHPQTVLHESNLEVLKQRQQQQQSD